MAISVKYTCDCCAEEMFETDSMEQETNMHQVSVAIFSESMYDKSVTKVELNKTTKLHTCTRCYKSMLKTLNEACFDGKL
jgi:hypothetical protein